MKRILIGLLATAGVLLAAGFVVYFAFGEGLARELAMLGQPPQKKAEFHAWRTQKIQLPAEALVPVTPFSPDTMRLGTQLVRAYRANEAKAKRIEEVSKHMDASEFTFPGEEIQIFSEFMDAFQEILGRDDYQITAIADHDQTRADGIYASGYFATLLALKILRMEQRRLADEGSAGESWKRVELILRSAKAEDFSEIIAHLICLSALSIGAGAAAEFLAGCDDPALLRRAAESLRKARGEAEVFRKDVDLWVLDRVGMARFLGHYGVQLRFADRTREQLSKEWLRAASELREPYIWADYRKDPAGQEHRLRRFLDEKQKLEDAYRGSRLSAPPRALAESFLFLIDTAPDAAEFFRREKTTVAKLDAVRSDLAAKIREIETGKAIEDPSELVPEFFSELPNDPFASNGRLGFASGRFYSIGPDGADDSAGLLYDPTNGTVSRGDVFLPRD